MKTILLFALILIFFNFADAQWQKQTVETKAGLRGLAVVSEKIIWASGTNGTVLRTLDGGRNWQVLKVPHAEKLDFRDIEAFDADTAYILSIGEVENSRIYKTIDGRGTWYCAAKPARKLESSGPMSSRRSRSGGIWS